MLIDQWERLLEMGTPNEIRCALRRLSGDELHYRLMDALEAVFERGVGAGKAIARREFERQPPELSGFLQ